jgi:NAD(P)-dependent dehydrogenase (short-subunit alcohol dehydrogenase family)
MLPLLRQAPAARIVNVSSTLGSLTLSSDRTSHLRSLLGIYSWSKTALNAITVAFAADLESAGIKVNAACPGFTATDLNNFEGTRTVQQAAREPVRLALLDANGPTGTYSNEDGQLPWWCSRTSNIGNYPAIVPWIEVLGRELFFYGTSTIF